MQACLSEEKDSNIAGMFTINEKGVAFYGDALLFYKNENISTNECLRNDLF